MTTPHNRGAGGAGLASLIDIHPGGADDPTANPQRGAPMREDISIDQIELLTTAAVQWRIAVPDAAPSPSRFKLSGDQTASLLLELRSIVIQGAEVADTYTFTAVEWPQALAVVLKAVHAYEHACEPLTAWHGSVAQQMLDAIARAAIERLPGYSEAPWVWSRSRPAASLVVGIATGWHPEIAGVAWYDPTIDPATWSDARAVLVTAAAWSGLPSSLPSRPGLYLIGSSPEALPGPWPSGIAPAARLVWPSCADFVKDLVKDGLA